MTTRPTPSPEAVLNLREEIAVQTDIRDGLQARMAKQDNGYQHHKLICVSRTLDRLKRSLAAHESKGEAA